jgi:hypothetical protein
VFNREAPGLPGGLTGYGESTYWVAARRVSTGNRGCPRFHNTPEGPGLAISKPGW